MTAAAATRRLWLIGASSGIGRALARALADPASVVIASARRREELEELAENSAGRIVPWPLDVTEEGALAAAADEIDEQLGPIDVMVYAAAAWEGGESADLDAAAFAKKYQVNLFGAVAATEAVMRAMLRRGAGHIVIVSSVAGYRGLPRAATYGSSKAALINLAESLRVTYAPKGIKVQLVTPGFVETRLTDQNDFPMPFIITPEKAARYMAEGMASDRFEITFPKRFTYILKLLRILPYPLYFWITSKMNR